MVAMIHDNRELPRVGIEGMALLPGRRHRLTYRRRASYSMPAPYSDCTDNIPLAMQAMFDQYDDVDYAYSQAVCNRVCQQEIL